MKSNVVEWRISIKNPYIFRSKKYGVIRLRTLVTLRDLELLIGILAEKDIDSRTFTVRVLEQIAIHSSKKIKSWDDRTILMLARRWSNKALSIDADNIKINNFDDFRLVTSTYVNETNKSFKDIAENLGTVITDQIKPLVSQINLSVKEMSQQVFSSANIIQSLLKPLLPEFSNIFASFRELVENERKVKENLNSSEYELAPLILNTSELFSINVSTFNPTITKKLVDRTRKDEFIKETELLFSSPRLRKRLSVIKQALVAHKNRQYYLSTPIFIVQAEGLFTDWLILLRLVKRKNGGIVDRKDNRKLNSLKPKAKYAKENISVDGLLEIAINNTLMRTVNKRNAILHGESNNYGTAKNSTQALLLMLLFAGVLESEIKPR